MPGDQQYFSQISPELPFGKVQNFSFAWKQMNPQDFSAARRQLASKPAVQIHSEPAVQAHSGSSFTGQIHPKPTVQIHSEPTAQTIYIICISIFFGIVLIIIIYLLYTKLFKKKEYVYNPVTNPTTDK